MREVAKPPRFTADRVAAVVHRVAGAPPDDLSHVPTGWANENWRCSVRGQGYIVKLGPPGSARKWAATSGTYGLARAAGLPVPDLAHFEAACELVDGWTVRLLTWMEGVPAGDALEVGTPAPAFFRDLAGAMKRLHALPAAGFSSRLDGSAPTFAVWSAYVGRRLPAILERVRAAGAFSEAEASAVVSEIERLLPLVDHVARPSICHRDLHLANLLADGDRRLAAVLDFDGAEAWDPAVDVVKLRWLVFPSYPGSEEAFNEAYGREPEWETRVRITELLELFNVVPNAVLQGDADFAAKARGRLRDLLA